ncbi:GAF domain-containing protein [Halanaerobium saccharolyticum]|uniref:GAF domain-containing protein n=1 Tax=Halanaerobium saccharolyticum TaxID=43595 RepID=A0A4R7Z7W5_9FIRM|nr:GAF domain-containing protein [Halanaerobium saccharolyticum]RAK11887.1 GAF domain-containing protein [Halanaerobium saccharolyticum]TDW07728.1 GAF domain-containing protein [Halanaerobium saccharolyticum]TDX64649.1 GAF domain-containing protein [Halanaerobium saccharolyticum]
MSKKEERLKEMNQALKALIEPEGDWLANLANSSALLFDLMDDLNWAGFYIWKNDQLVLGPFQGKTACVRIDEDKGVCGTAYSQRKIMLVEDVTEFPGHIACDPDSRSEIVLPVIVGGEVIAVLDIDSPQKARFDELDRKYLKEFVDILVDETNFLPLMEKF